jgi:hypothetical protein
VNDLASTIRSSADSELAAGWAPDWDDVLARAGVSPRPRRAVLSRRTAAVGGLIAAVLLLTLPGIGIGGRLQDLVAGSSPPGFELRASLAGPGGRSIGSVTLHTSRLFVAVSPQTGRILRPVVPRRPLQPLQLRWTIDLTGGAMATSARIERAGPSTHVFARLCAPCRDGAHGVIHLDRAGLTALFGRRAVAVVETNEGQVRGVLGLEPPAHRRG